MPIKSALTLRIFQNQFESQFELIRLCAWRDRSKRGWGLFLQAFRRDLVPLACSKAVVEDINIFFINFPIIIKIS